MKEVQNIRDVSVLFQFYVWIVLQRFLFAVVDAKYVRKLQPHVVASGVARYSYAVQHRSSRLGGWTSSKQENCASPREMGSMWTPIRA